MEKSFDRFNNPGVTTRPEEARGPAALDPAARLRPPLITVAICTRNRASLLEQAILSVLPQIMDDTEILIVDNNSNDDTAQRVTAISLSHRCVTMCRESAAGISAVRNRALTEARGEYVLFFDDDELADPGWLEAYRGFLRQPPSERMAGVGGEVVPRFEVAPAAWINPANFEMNFGSHSRRLDGDSFPGCGNCAYHRARALAAGGFCTRLGRYEESELSMRLRRQGFEIWWLTGARILHLIPASRLTLRWLGRTAFSEGRSVALLRLRNIRKRFARSFYLLGRLALAPIHCAVNLLAAVLLIPFRRRQFAARSLLRAIRIAGQGWQLMLETARGPIRANIDD